MHLLVDAQCLQSPDSGTRGIGRYARGLLNALAAARPTWRIEAVENGSFPALDRAALDSRLIVTRLEPLFDQRASARAANEQFFGEWLSARGADAILELNFFEEQMMVPRFPRERPPLCGVVYDLIPVLFHDRYLSSAEKVEWYAQRLRQFSEVDLALAISETTRNDVRRLLRWPAEKVTTILGAPETIRVPVSPEDPEAVLADLGIVRPFLLCVAGDDVRKNLRGTLEGFAATPSAIRSATQLVVACALSPLQRREWESCARDLGIADAVLFTGFVSDERLRVLHERCRASVFLSFYEGLGLPVLEALRAGAPVVASNRSSIPEFSELSTILVDPASSAGIAGAIAAALSRPRDEGAQARRRFAAQFTWERTAALASGALETMRRPVRTGDRRLRVAWVSPLPPTHSGIADYSGELLEHLPGDELDVELVVSAQAVVDPRLAARYRVVSESSVDARHATAPFDLFVYHVGNSPLHIYMLELMRRYSGLVVLHELFLGGLALRATEVGAWPGLAKDLAEEGAADLAAAMRAGEADHARIAGAVPLNRRLVAMGEGVVAHSIWSWRQLRTTAPVPVFHIPMGMALPEPPRVADARARLELEAGAFVVATLGEVNASKRLDRVIDALSRVSPALQHRLQFVVVGGVETSLRESLVALARDAGLAQRLRFTGRVSLDDLTTWARAADACVQLRYPVRGETSAALLRALAAGGACIVSDTDGFAEVPPEAALRVRTPDHEIADLSSALTRLSEDAALGDALRGAAVAFMQREHRLEDAGQRYAAAIALTAGRRRARDGEWRDAATSALAEAAGDVAIDDRAIARWADVHASLRSPDVGSLRRR
jgi:glycosyltransferase involved in cell wall biosynthesis